MWHYDETGETAASPADVWAVLSDLNDRASWDTSMESVRLDGPFAVGSTVTMKPIGQDPIRATIRDIVPNETYTRETDSGGVALQFRHTLPPRSDGGTSVRETLTITGPAADEIGPKLGPQLPAGFPEAILPLLRRLLSDDVPATPPSP